MIQAAVNAINRNLERGSFVFAEAFPGATEEEKEFFSKKEGREYVKPPEEFTFSQAHQIWLNEKFYKLIPETTQKEYNKALRPHILPFFGDKSFDEINDESVYEFFSTRYRFGDKSNGLAAEKTMMSIKTPLVDIWDFTNRRMKWSLDSPFENIGATIKFIANQARVKMKVGALDDPKLEEAIRKREADRNSKNIREVILFRAYMKILEHVDEYYRPIIEFALLTGMSSSEMAGIHMDAIQDDGLHVYWSISDKELKDTLKKTSRTRITPITKAIRRVLDDALKNKPEGSFFLFQTVTGLPLYDRPIREAWDRAIKKAEVKRVVPYSLRHRFVAYCKLMGIPEPRVIGLMGHVDRRMIIEIYGNYKNDSEKDLAEIRAYFGEDFYGRK
jgi:integrase